MVLEQNVGAPTFRDLRSFDLECGSLLPLLQLMRGRPNDRMGSGAGIARAAASRRTPKCRRADNFCWAGKVSHEFGERP